MKGGGAIWHCYLFVCLFGWLAFAWKWRKVEMFGYQRAGRCPRLSFSRFPIKSRTSYRAWVPSKKGQHAHHTATFQCLNELSQPNKGCLRKTRGVWGLGDCHSPFMCKLWAQYNIDSESIKEMSLKLIGDILILNYSLCHRF